MSITANNFSYLLTISFLIPQLSNPTLSSHLIDQLNQSPPPNFLTTITNNCLRRPSLPYCNSASSDLPNIFKSTVVASHLCNLSNNPNCPTSFLSINLQSLPKLAPLYLSFSFFWKYCPSSIQSINLSNNSLLGPFPSQTLHCTQTQSLDLSRNLLSGSLPLESLALLPNLSRLNLSYNQFDPQLDEKAVAFFGKFKDSSFVHSGLLKDCRFKMKTTVLLLICVPAFIASVVGCLVRRIGKRREFSERMLRKATEGFSEDRLVEKSEKLEIYKGRLVSGKEVEIKIERGKKFRTSFVEECRVLVKVRHENIVKVLGWYVGREMRAIVMKRVEGEILGEWLLRSPMWKERMKVAVGIGGAMSFLEEEWPHITCDLKVGNLMVIEGGEPLIMKLKVHDHSYSCSRGNVHYAFCFDSL